MASFRQQITGVLKFTAEGLVTGFKAEEPQKQYLAGELLDCQHDETLFNASLLKILLELQGVFSVQSNTTTTIMTVSEHVSKHSAVTGQAVRKSRPQTHMIA